jgi:MFS family permease
VAALPGYALAVTMMDRIGHRKLQLADFTMMGACFAVIGLVPGLTTAVVPFLLAYGISYFFTEFGPNVTAFVIPGELFRTEVRATAHGIAAGAGKLGAFIGVFLFPVLQDSLGLRGTLLLTAAISACGALLTLVLPEPAGRALAEVSGDGGLKASGPGVEDDHAAHLTLPDPVERLVHLIERQDRVHRHGQLAVRQRLQCPLDRGAHGLVRFQQARVAGHGDALAVQRPQRHLAFGIG